jgi:hypothetical protein
MYAFLNLAGCVYQQADLKQTERELQHKIKQVTEEQAQTRARQSQEIVSLREQSLPALRGDVDKIAPRVNTLNARLEEVERQLKSIASSGVSAGNGRAGAGAYPSSQADNDLRLDQHDELISALLTQVQELSRLVKERASR